MRVQILCFILFCCVLSSLSALSVNEQFIQACRDGDVVLAKRFLDEGAYIEYTDDGDHQTAIVWAAGKGHFSIVKLLLERGANINAQDDNGWSALSEASYDGHAKVVELLLQKKASTLPSTGWVTETKHGNAVFWCVESAFNTYQQKIEIVKLLLQHNAEPEGENDQKLDTLGIAKSRNYKEIVVMLEKFTKDRVKKKNEYALLEAIKMRDIKKVEEYLAKNVNPNLLLPNGESMLNRAVAMQHLEIVRLLLEHGANPNTQNDLGTSALMQAVRGNNIAIVKLLLSSGANPNQEDTSGQNVLFYAVQSNDINMMFSLFNAGININAKNNYGETALFYAIKLGNLPAVELLISKGCNPSATNRNGSTALHLAAQKGRLDLVRLILKTRGVDADATDNNDHTALYYARKSGNAQVIKVLKRVTKEDEEDLSSDTHTSKKDVYKRDDTHKDASKAENSQSINANEDADFENDDEIKNDE